MLPIGIALLFCAAIVSIGAIGLMLTIMLAFSFADRISGWIRFRANQVRAARQSVSNAYETSGIQTVGSTIRCLFFPTVVMAVFIGLSGAAQREWELSGASLHTLERMQTIPQSPSTREMVNSTTREFGFEGSPIPAQDLDQVLAQNHPKWITDGDMLLGEDKLIVLTSKLWSTEAEARQELQSRVAELIRADFEGRHHRMFDPTGYRSLNEAQMAQVAVKQRYIERFNQDFGKFQGPMNREFWQVEISPTVRTELYPAWKTAAAQNRVVVIGTVLAILTLMANTLSLYTGQKSTSLRGTVVKSAINVACILSWITVELAVASRLLA